MSVLTRITLMMLMMRVWVVMVQSECITNPMDDINKKAKQQYLTTDEFLEDMKKSSLNKYQNLLRVYGIYRSCVESGTKKWTDNGNTGSKGCPYCRTKIEEEDKVRPKLPDAWNSSSCAAAKYCHESQQGCFHYGVRGSEEECKRLGWNRDGSDYRNCVGDGNTDLGDFTCQLCRDDEVLRTDWCPIMCGYCRPRCPFFCKNWGFMKPNSCQCFCNSPFTERQCEGIDCSKHESDYPRCARFTKEQCGKEIKSMRCPNLCGLCQKSYQDEEDDGSGAIEK